ncbi:MAG: ChaN family lipoprotein [Acidobacteriota bacterium]
MSIRAAIVACLIAGAGTAGVAQVAYVPQRVFVSAKGQFADFETLLADVARADVVLVGEEHNDPNTHRVELAMLQGLARRRGEIVVAMEMFERDVQEPLAHFLMGHTSEDEFLRDSRPWPDYSTSYKPLVDFAMSKDWPIVAANVPRTLAAEVSQSGLEVLNARSDADKTMFARELRCPTNDAYFKRFAETMREGMGDHSSNGTTSSAAGKSSLDRYYQAQCLKDETMSESIAQSYAAGAIGGKRPLVVSFNGAFHSDFGQGITERTKRRLPDKRILTIAVVPTESLDQLAPDKEARKRADYLVYTIKDSAPVPAGPPAAVGTPAG